mgnify:CR=1 FL=1
MHLHGPRRWHLTHRTGAAVGIPCIVAIYARVATMICMPLSKRPAPWVIETLSRNVHRFRFTVRGSGWVQDMLLISDLHWDNPHCNRELLRQHMDQAVERNAPIIVVGDMFCLMQGKYDPRSSGDDIRPEHVGGNYLDKVIQTAVDWFAPYAEHLALVGQGNHETNILKRHETDMTERFCSAMRYRHGAITQAGGYGGFIRFAFKIRKTVNASQVMYYHHGFGGGGPVTMGKIDWSRYMMQVQADMYAAGHVHYKESFPIQVGYLNPSNRVCQKPIHCIRLGTYKDEWVDGHGGFHIEKGRGPRPLGGYWLRFGCDKQGITRTIVEC